MSKKINHSDYIMSEFERQRARQKYEDQKSTMESTPAYIRAEKGRSLIKKMTYTNNKLSQVRLEAFNEMSKELLEFIQQDLIANTELMPQAQAAEIMNFYKRTFLDLEELSNGTHQNAVYNQPYDKFFLELIKLNPYFIYFARPQTFEIANIPIGKISYSERMETLLPHLQAMGLFENEKFLNRYSKYFEPKKTIKKI